ncbi:MAG TPA: signal peptidase II [Stellaceae bacterium]|jgi:signal peptidase II|nr:signal peptidase II [Stellaceae bacterium]
MLGRGLAVAVAAALFDQLSKGAVLTFFDEGGCALHRVVVTGFLDLVLTCNSGVSFGLFNRSGLSAAIFSLAAALIVIVLMFWLTRVKATFLAVAIGLIIGGAIGNVLDRLRYGAVIDFLYFHVGSWYWPAFNLADSAICLGVSAMLLDGLLLRRAAPQAKGREDLSP